MSAEKCYLMFHERMCTQVLCQRSTVEDLTFQVSNLRIRDFNLKLL